MLVYAEDFLHYEHHRKAGPRCGHGAIGHHVAVFGRHLDFASDQSVGRRSDGLRRNRQDRRGETGTQRGHDKAAAAQIIFRQERVDFVLRGVLTGQLLQHVNS